MVAVRAAVRVNGGQDEERARDGRVVLRQELERNKRKIRNATREISVM